ncbi:MAG: signal peptidase I [Acidobacteria bacterium]|nr:signal peptidase I [Acidobacteriota bacterium]
MNLPGGGQVREWLKSLSITLLFVWLFTNHVAQATEVPSESMKPTILAGDHFFLDKVAFPANYPQAIKKYLPGRQIRRGDIVAFWSPQDRSVRLVKRVIGLPGETIEIRDRQVFVNGRTLNEPYKIHLDPNTHEGRDSFGPVTVSKGQYFMLGDNRDNSNDSRYWGFARREDFIGKPLFIYWSYDNGPYDPQNWSIVDWANHFVSVSQNFFYRTRWFRAGSLVR